jgi:hypothetical protein
MVRGKPDPEEEKKKKVPSTTVQVGSQIVSSPEEEKQLIRQRELAAGAAQLAQLPSSFQVQQAEEQQVQQRGEFEETTGSAALKETLTEKALAPPSLEPPPLSETVGLSPREFQPIGITGVASAASFLQDPKKGIRNALAETAVGSLLPLFSAIPAAATAITTTKIGAAVAGTSTSVKLLAGGFLASVLGGKVTDLQRNDISTLRGVLGKMSGQSSTIQSAVQNGGMTPQDAIQALNELANSVDEAESSLKQKAIYNVRFRTSKEYLETEQIIKDARFNILERVGGVENLAITGRTASDPQALILNLQDLEGENE